VQRYSQLDQYAMGLLSESQVPSFFYVESPANVVPSRDAASAPRVGVTFNGTRRDVLIQDVIAIEGPRIPSVADSSKVHRQAFIYLVSAGRSQDAGQIDKVDRIRRQWEPFFQQATDGRMRVDTRR
jgi:large repetitive protein